VVGGWGLKGGGGDLLQGRGEGGLLPGISPR